MSRPSGAGSAAAGSRGEGLGRLLDLAFGFLVWGAHFLAVYAATAIACVLGLPAASPRASALFSAALVLATLAAAGAVAWHAVRRCRGDRTAPDARFRAGVAIGGDAIAALAIAWQLFAILLVPACR